MRGRPERSHQRVHLGRNVDDHVDAVGDGGVDAVPNTHFISSGWVTTGTAPIHPMHKLQGEIERKLRRRKR